MPITIPMMQRRSSSGPMLEGAGIGAATFVPPHLIYRTTTGSEEETLLSVSHAGGSPSNDPKRERLKARNAILRRTGFIEIQPHAAPIAELLDPVKQAALLAADASAGASPNSAAHGGLPVPPGRKALDRRLQPSSLTALLGTSK